MNKFLVFALILVSKLSYAQSQDFGKIICDSFNDEISKNQYEKNFSKSFRKDFDYDSHKKFFSGIVEKYGNCKKVETSQISDGKKLVSVYTKEFKNLFNIVYNEKDLITGLWTSGVESQSGLLEKKAQYICSLMKKDFKLNYNNHFEQSFIDAVPEKQVVAIFKNIFSNYGECKNIKTYPNTNTSAVLISENNEKLIFNIDINSNTKKISGLLYKGVEQKPIVIKSKKDLDSFLSKTPGKSTMTFKSENSDIYSFNKKEKLALGSTFKLYILLTLQEKITKGEYKWDDLLVIEEHLKSLPSGDMQNIPAGEKRTIFEFAKKMIKISDNTATDHLLNLVGKESVEKKLKESGVIHGGNFPFLSTMEMFRTRAFFSLKDVEKYKRSNREQRLLELSRLSKKPYDEFIAQISKWGNKPKYISEIEWFSSSDEVCTLLFDLKNTNSKEVLEILSFNAPVIDKENIEYAGYKGGSEPGVIYMAYLLKKKKEKNWYCFLSGVNDTKAPVDQDKFFEFIKGSSKYLLNK